MKFTKAAAVVFFVVALTYAYFYQDPGDNGSTRFALTMAIVKEGRLNIDTFNSVAGGYSTNDVATYQGKYYTDKPIGSSVLGAVVYYPIYTILHLFGKELSVPDQKHILTFLVLGLPSAVVAALIFVVCEFISKSRFRAFIVAMAISLGTMCFPFSIVYFGHELAASLLFGAFFLIFQIKNQADPVKIKNFRIFLIGLLLGLAFLTDMTTAVIVLPLMAYYFYVLWTRKLIKRVTLWVIPALGGLIPILLMAAYNIQVYGTLFASGYQYLVDPIYREGMAKGLMGIQRPNLHVLFYETLFPAQGIFWQSPVLLMAVVGGFFMLRKKQFWAELAVAAIACGAYLLINSGYFMWWGGWSFGVRLVIPMLPFLCLPLIFVPQKVFPLVIGLTFISVVQMGIVAASNVRIPDEYFAKTAQLGFFEYSAIYSNCWQKLVDGNFAWNLGQALFGLKNWASLLPISIIISGATLFMALFPTRLDHSPQSQVERLAS